MPVETWKSLFDVTAVVLLGLTFVAAGGALITGNMINRAQKEKLRKFDSDLTIAKSDLAKQQERAAKAEAAISLADQHAAEADSKAEGFRLDIAKSNEASNRAQAQVAEATAEAAEATKASEAEKIERLKLEQQIEPRRLTADQVQKIVKQCQPFKGRIVRAISYASDPESAILAKQLEDALSASGINVQNGIASFAPMGGFLTSIYVTGSDQDLVASLRRIFSTAGNLFVVPGRWEAAEQQYGSFLRLTGPTPDVTVFVGLKPVK